MGNEMCKPEKYNITLEPCNPCKSEPIKIIIENRCCPCCKRHKKHCEDSTLSNKIPLIILILVLLKCCI